MRCAEALAVTAHLRRAHLRLSVTTGRKAHSSAVEHHAARRNDASRGQHLAPLSLIQMVTEEWRTGLRCVHPELVRAARFRPEPKKRGFGCAGRHLIPGQGLTLAAPRPCQAALGVARIN